MPSKKPNKAAKRPGKATPKKATHKVAAPKKVLRPPTKAAPPRSTSKVIVKPNKPALKSVIAKPAVKPVPVKAPRAKPEPVAKVNGDKVISEKIAPIKFDTRPLVVTRLPQGDEDGDGETAASASLLAGPRNVKPYIARRGEQYMNKEQLEHFARILRNWKRDLMVEVDRTVLHMKDEAANFPDPNDRATQEEEFSLELRTRDRERKLIRKIDEALKRIEDGSYGYCLETGEEIGIKRLEARPVATLSVEAQERRDRREKQYGDRDDRYR
jgi:DnaK suppressor protein